MYQCGWACACVVCVCDCLCVCVCVCLLWFVLCTFAFRYVQWTTCEVLVHVDILWSDHYSILDHEDKSNAALTIELVHSSHYLIIHFSLLGGLKVLAALCEPIGGKARCLSSLCAVSYPCSRVRRRDDTVHRTDVDILELEYWVFQGIVNNVTTPEQVNPPAVMVCTVKHLRYISSKWLVVVCTIATTIYLCGTLLVTI